VGEEQESGVRSQESGVRSQKSGVRSQESEVRRKSICFLLSAFCLLPTAYCVCGEFELAGLLARTADYDKMSQPTGKERTSNFKK
jgi:hypothetical protein